jgi:hypothetical protein
MCRIGLRDLVWNCGGRTAGCGHSTSGQCVVPLLVVVALSAMVDDGSVVSADRGGGGDASNGGVSGVAVSVALIVVMSVVLRLTVVLVAVFRTAVLKQQKRVCNICWCMWAMRL